jgi:hypothetical protein
VNVFGWSLLVWGLGWGGAFLLLELLAVADKTRGIAARSPIAAMGIAGRFVLLLNFVLPNHWPRGGRVRKNEPEGRN